MVDLIFWTGVEFLKWLANGLGLSYQEIIVYLFIFFIPANPHIVGSWLRPWLGIRDREACFATDLLCVF